MIEKEVQELLSFIDGNPTAYHTTASVRNILLNAGFSELLESRRWQLEPGRSYFVCRNGSSILAFRMGEQLENYSFNVAAAHTDSPCFRIKENAEIHMGRKYTKLNTEGYGGMICSTWMDRPLSVAGRVLIKENNAITSRLLTLDRDLLMIPSVAIHMDREVNDRASYNKQVDMLPLLGGAAEEGVLKKLIAAELQVAEEQILGSDLFLCIREKAAVWGCNEEFISSGRLDDQQCVFGILKGFLNRTAPSPSTLPPSSTTKKWVPAPSRAQLPPSCTMYCTASRRTSAPAMRTSTVRWRPASCSAPTTPTPCTPTTRNTPM